MTDTTSGLMDAARAAHQAARAETLVERTRENTDRLADERTAARVALEDLIGEADANAVDLTVRADGVTTELGPLHVRYSPDTRSWTAANWTPACPKCRQHPPGPRLETLADLGAALETVDYHRPWPHDCQPAAVHHVAACWPDKLAAHLDREHAAGYRYTGMTSAAGEIVVVTRLRTAG